MSAATPHRNGQQRKWDTFELGRVVGALFDEQKAWTASVVEATVQKAVEAVCDVVTKALTAQAVRLEVIEKRLALLESRSVRKEIIRNDRGDIVAVEES